MPTATGQFTLSDYDNELIARGFDGLTQTRRYQFINLAYRRIARRFPWLWEKTTATITKNPGDSVITIVGATPDLVNFRSLDEVYVVTDPYRKRLTPESREKFYAYWLTLDLAAAANRGTPDHYFIEDQQIYLLPPPQTTVQLLVHYHRRVTDLSTTTLGVTDVPITPTYLDEAILKATLSETHKSVYEVQLAAQMEADLGDIIGQMLEDEDWQDPNEQERVAPDDTWL